jgi:hypothetical protein
VVPSKSGVIRNPKDETSENSQLIKGKEEKAEENIKCHYYISVVTSL